MEKEQSQGKAEIVSFLKKRWAVIPGAFGTFASLIILYYCSQHSRYQKLLEELRKAIQLVLCQKLGPR